MLQMVGRERKADPDPICRKEEIDSEDLLCPRSVMGRKLYSPEMGFHNFSQCQTGETHRRS